MTDCKSVILTGDKIRAFILQAYPLITFKAFKMAEEAKTAAGGYHHQSGGVVTEPWHNNDPFTIICMFLLYLVVVCVFRFIDNTKTKQFKNEVLQYVCGTTEITEDKLQKYDDFSKSEVTLTLIDNPVFQDDNVKLQFQNVLFGSSQSDAGWCDNTKTENLAFDAFDAVKAKFEIYKILDNPTFQGGGKRSIKSIIRGSSRKDVTPSPSSSSNDVRVINPLTGRPIDPCGKTGKRLLQDFKAGKINLTRKFVKLLS